MFRGNGASAQGVRPTNEDRFVVDERLALAIVADGMGGHNAGEIAAQLAIDAVIDVMTRFEPAFAWPFGFDDSLSDAANRLRTAIHVANMRVREAGATDAARAGMATTVVAAFVAGDRLIVGHAGDSRAYLLTEHGLCPLTQDDSWVAAMLAQNPAADRAALDQHPMRHAVTNVVGARARTEVHMLDVVLSGGEVVLLTTDGVHGVLDDQSLGELVAVGGTPEQTAERLVSAALERGSRDNCTAVVVRYST